MKDIKNPKEMNYWHEPFFFALKLELYDYRDVLTFTNEYKLSEEALRIDENYGVRIYFKRIYKTREN